MILVFSDAALNARFVGGLQALLDVGPVGCRIQLFAASTPSGPVLAELVLARPSGAMVGLQYVLQQADPEGDLILREGTPQSGRMINGAGVRVCDGDVSGIDGDGVFRVEGDDGPLLHAGGRARLLASYFF
ncbi:hypothetical protein DBA29_17280 [Xenophilus aerolatus]|nr:hypothetical protein [Xenophilus aerolatus]